VFELVIDGLPCDAKFVAMILVPSTDGRNHLKDHIGHDAKTLIEGEFLGVLQDGVVIENLLEFGWVEDSLQSSLHHDADRAGLDELLERRS